MQEKIGCFAKNHPMLFSGAWFALSALLLVWPLGAMILLLFGLDLAGGSPGGAYLGIMLASVWLPVGSASGTGALVGPRILRLPSSRHGRAAGWGAAAALGALLLWILLLEGVPRLFGGQMPPAGGGGDVPGAAEVVGYVVVLPLIVVLSLLVGAAAGLLLHVLAAAGMESEET